MSVNGSLLDLSQERRRDVCVFVNHFCFLSLAPGASSQSVHEMLGVSDQTRPVKLSAAPASGSLVNLLHVYLVLVQLRFDLHNGELEVPVENKPLATFSIITNSRY